MLSECFTEHDIDYFVGNITVIRQTQHEVVSTLEGLVNALKKWGLSPVKIERFRDLPFH